LKGRKIKRLVVRVGIPIIAVFRYFVQLTDEHKLMAFIT